MDHADTITWNWTDNAYAPIQHAVSFHSTLAGEAYGFGIYLPPSYDTETHRRYPVIYWLHGYSSRPHYAGYMTERLDAAIRRGEAPEAIVVAVNGLYPAVFCDDASGRRPVESIIMQELIPFVDEQYRTPGGRSGRFLEGFSRGGFGAAHLAFRYPETFGGLSMLAGAFHGADELHRVRPILFDGYFGGNQAHWARDNAFDLARGMAGRIDQQGPFPMRMVVGDADEGQYEGNLRFHAHLRALGLACELVVVPGAGHTVRALYDDYPGGKPFSFFTRAMAGTTGTPEQKKAAKSG